MSWCVNRTGTKEKVRTSCEIEFDKAIKQYGGLEEQKDVLAAKSICLSAIDACEFTEWANALSVECSGHRHSGGVSCHVKVERILLLV